MRQRARPFVSACWLLALSLLLAVHGANAADAEWVRVQRVLDGDSVRLEDGREVRLIGLNTPEFGRNGAPDQPLAAAARGRTAALLHGAPARLVHDKERFDRHGRTLAYLELRDGRDVQELLIREGLAWYVAVSPNTARLAAYQRAEAEARAAGRGVWTASLYEPIAAEAVTSAHAGFVRVRGTVRTVSNQRYTVTLYLTGRVSLALPHGELARPPQSLLGKHVLARGWLTEYKKSFRMRITHPAMLELAP